MIPRNVIVCGGRAYDNRSRVWEILNYEGLRPHDAILVGSLQGADGLAREWAVEHGIPSAVVDAPWTYYGLKAGPLRNGWMLHVFGATEVIAFPGGAGTANMVSQARAAGLPVRKYS